MLFPATTKTAMRTSLLAIIVAMTACGGTVDGMGETLRTPHGNRQYVLHLPARAPEGTYPLVVVMHGGGGNATRMQAMTHFDALADREGFAVVYPQSVAGHWNDGRNSDRVGATDDDVGFIRQLLDELVARYPIDRSRIFATGISNGGIMSYRLGCEMSDWFAAIAPVAGQVSEGVAASCTPTHRFSVLAMNGTADPQVPWRGGQVFGNRGAILGTPASLELMARVNGCAGEQTASWEPDRDQGDGTTIQHVSFGGCADHVVVELLNINNGGHTWPGGPQYLSPALIGPVSREFSATERIWQFFAEHGRH